MIIMKVFLSMLKVLVIRLILNKLQLNLGISFNFEKVYKLCFRFVKVFYIYCYKFDSIWKYVIKK